MWATPWFARIFVIPSMNLVKSVFRKGGKKATAPGAAGVGAAAKELSGGLRPKK